jgi:homoserine O-acetyltransferase/O-succinyltransferase
VTGGTARTTGAWREGDPVGRRRFAEVGTVSLERGGAVPDVRVAYETWGELAPDRSNAVLVLHALTGDSHVAGEAVPGHPTGGWWDGLVGPGRALDTTRWFVVAPNVLGGCQGTTGPASAAPDGQPWGARFPYLTVRDQVEVERRLTDQLGIGTWAAVVGGSMGGMRVLEWAVTHPDRVRGIAPIAVCAAASADQIALQTIQLQAIRTDPAYRGGDYLRMGGPAPEAGLALARRLAHWTYRSSEELEQRFGRRSQAGEEPLGGGGRFAVSSYLDHHGEKLVRRFDAHSYVVLTESMNGHDVGRDRGGIAPALARYGGEVAIAGIDSDRLYPIAQQDELARHLIGPEARASVVRSPYGHDSFLLEVEAIGAVLRELLARVAVGADVVERRGAGATTGAPHRRSTG